MKSGTALATCTATPMEAVRASTGREDPTLDYFNGYYEAQAMQGVGVTMCVKHMCCNDQEAQRTGLSVFVDEQALRETYLRAFEGSFARRRAERYGYHWPGGTHAGQELRGYDDHRPAGRVGLQGHRHQRRLCEHRLL